MKTLITNIWRRVAYYLIRRRVLINDVKKYQNYYTDSFVGDNATRILYERGIMVLCHRVEKGLSHNQLKPLFGINNVKKISEYLCAYIELENPSEYIINLAYTTLKEYNEVNERLGAGKDIIYIPTIENIKKIEVGVDEISKEKYFENSNGVFEDILKSRRSVRLYDIDSDSVSVDLLKKVIKDAMICPSACNRQAVRVKIITDKEMIKKISEVQGGATGFGEKSGALLIVTADIRYYMVSERKMPMLDCGIFIMNLCYSLYNKQLGACVLNGSMSIKKEKEMRSLIVIPEYEMISAIVAVSNIPNNTKFKVAKSCKKDIEDIVTVL